MTIILVLFHKMISVPADVVKGKTWGPSTFHQRERVHIIDGSPSYSSSPTTTAIKGWSKSAPNLEKHPSSVRSNFAALREIGTLSLNNDEDETI